MRLGDQSTAAKTDATTLVAGVVTVDDLEIAGPRLAWSDHWFGTGVNDPSGWKTRDVAAERQLPCPQQPNNAVMRSVLFAILIDRR
jgi:hypothetical protein